MLQVERVSSFAPERRRRAGACRPRTALSHEIGVEAVGGGVDRVWDRRAVRDLAKVQVKQRLVVGIDEEDGEDAEFHGAACGRPSAWA